MEATELAATVTAFTTIIYTAGTFLLWRATQRTAKLTEQQVRRQVQSSQSLAHHSVLDGHRALFIKLATEDSLLDILAEEFGKEKSEVRKQFLASTMINHVLRVFLDYKKNLSLDTDITSFEADAREIFSIPFIKNRWEEVREFHPATFRTYIDSHII